jgi:hypothetical protein
LLELLLTIWQLFVLNISSARYGTYGRMEPVVGVFCLFESNKFNFVRRVCVVCCGLRVVLVC